MQFIELKKFCTSLNKSGREHNWEVWHDEHGFRWIDHKRKFCSKLNQNADEFRVDSDAAFSTIEKGESWPPTQDLSSRVCCSGLPLEERYWEFMQSHPCHRRLHPVSETDALNALTLCLVDQALFSTSTWSLTREKCEELLDILRTFHSSHGKCSLRPFDGAVYRTQRFHS